MQAISELATLTQNLDIDDRKELELLLPDLISKTAAPRTEVAILKMKSLLKKGGPAFADAVRKIVVDITSEAFKKALFP
jgi:hypothetical protein